MVRRIALLLCGLIAAFYFYPATANAQQTPYEYIRLAPRLMLDLEEYAAQSPVLQIGDLPPRSPEQQRAYQKRTQWRWVALGTITLGTATLLTGVRLFNKGKNAKKIAVGDAMILIGVGIDIAVIGPLVMERYWHRTI
jgi:hypothetical protein